MRDTAVDEELEIDLGESPDVQVSVRSEKTAASIPPTPSCCRWCRE